MIKTRYIKSFVISDMIIELLNNYTLSKDLALRKYEISSITFYKYISTIRNILVEFNHYEYDLIYKKGYYQLIKYP